MASLVMKKPQPNGEPEPLDERTEKFARSVRALVRKLPRTISNAEDVKQLVRSSGSVAANYIEANEAVSHKDFVGASNTAAKNPKKAACGSR